MADKSVLQLSLDVNMISAKPFKKKPHVGDDGNLVDVREFSVHKLPQRLLLVPLCL